MRQWLLLIFLAVIAVNWPELPYNMRAADVAFAAAAIAVLGAVRNWPWPRFDALDGAIALYLLGSAVSAVFSPVRGVSAIELVRHLYVASIYIVIVVAVRQGLAHTVATGLALSGGVLAVLSVGATALLMITGIRIEAIGRIAILPYLGETLRVRALTASEAMLACVLAVSVPFVLLHPAIRSSRLRTGVAAFVLMVAALLTFSHSVAGIAVAILIAVWPSLPAPAPRRAAAAAVILLMLAANFAATVSIRSIGGSRDDSNYHYGIDGGRAEIAGVEVEYQTMSYLRIKQVAWDAFMSRPLVGIGLDRFHDITEAAYQQGRLTTPYRAIDPHSTFFGRFAEAGIAGGVTLLLLWLAIGRSMAQLLPAPAQYEWMALAAAAAITGTLVNTMNADVMNFRFLWVALGLVRGLSSMTRPVP
jgi:hypothetical protein